MDSMQDEATIVWESEATLPCGISPDGKWLCFIDGAPNLFLKELSSGATRPLTTDGSWVEGYPAGWDGGLVFSSDWKETAVGWLRADQSHWEVRVIPLDGSGPRTILNHDPSFASVRPKAWSLDGSRVALVATHADGTSDLQLLSVEDHSIQTVATIDIGGPRASVCFSPDGEFLAYESGIRIFVISSREGDLPSPVLIADGRLLAWASRGIYFTNQEHGEPSVFVAQVIDGQVRNAPAAVGKYRIGHVLGLNNEGDSYHRIVSHATQVFVAELDPDGVPVAPLAIASVPMDSSVAWSPDGSRLVHAVEADNRLQLVVRPLDGSESSFLGEPMLRFGGHAFQPHWSPDGSSILVQARDEQGVQGVYRVDSKTGNVRPVVQGKPGENVEWPVWCAGGRVMCTRWAPWTNVLVTIDPEDGSEAVLYKDSPPMAMAHLSASSSGEEIAYVGWDSSTGRTTVNGMNSSGGEPRELIELPQPALAGYEQPLVQLAWIPDSREVVCMTSTPQRQLGLLQVSVEDGATKPLDLKMEGVLPYGLSIHPDGRRIAFVAGRPSSHQVWKMRGFIS